MKPHSPVRHGIDTAAENGRHLSVELGDLTKALSYLPAVVAEQHVQSERPWCGCVRLDAVSEDLYLLGFGGH